ncbi:SDR family oxidoreductase [Streptomyces sp. NPDC059215]|uniref:SDR family oxidoreductase n=1 Tax=Streptomyces sp. NPDC059215 TaxID=3346772 RepID=UPI0036D05933
MTLTPSRSLALAGQTVLVIGGSAGVGLEVARQVRAEGGDVILTARGRERLVDAAKEIEPVSTATFDATDLDAVENFFRELSAPVDHVIVTAGGSYYAPLAEIDFAAARSIFEEKLWLAITVAQQAAQGKVRDGGSILFTSGTAPRRPAVGVSIPAASVGAMTAITRNLALELAPVRFNLIAAGFLDTPLSASLLGAGIDARREQLRQELPIRRVVEVSEVAALAVHIMTNGALTGAAYDIDGGESLLPAVEGKHPDDYR